MNPGKDVSNQQQQNQSCVCLRLPGQTDWEKGSKGEPEGDRSASILIEKEGYMGGGGVQVYQNLMKCTLKM